MILFFYHEIFWLRFSVLFLKKFRHSRPGRWKYFSSLSYLVGFPLEGPKTSRKELISKKFLDSFKDLLCLWAVVETKVVISLGLAIWNFHRFLNIINIYIHHKNWFWMPVHQQFWNWYFKCNQNIFIYVTK